MSDTSTRSGMLWEVERILTECKELGTMPTCLLMENVPQVHSEDNIQDFKKWVLRLEELGYSNYFQDLIATDYGIPQTRNRCFMISILGDYSYSFPPRQELKLKLKDMLESNVDEKYYLSDKMKKYIFSENDKYKVNPSNVQINREIACSKTTREGNTRADTSDYVTDPEYKKINEACDDLIKNNKVKENDALYTNFTTRRIKEDDFVQNNNISPTLTTSASEVGVVVGTYQYAKSDKFMQGKNRLQLGKDISDTLQTTQKEGIVVNEPQVLGGLGEKKSNGGTQWYQQDRIYDDNVAISVTTICNPYYKNNLRIRKLTPKECFRLMGVKDEDFENVRKNQSDSSLYHLAGDSIVVDVIKAIFGEML